MRISEAVLLMDLKSPKTSTLADQLIERTSSMVDKIESKSVHNDQEADG